MAKPYQIQHIAWLLASNAPKNVNKGNELMRRLDAYTQADVARAARAMVKKYLAYGSRAMVKEYGSHPYNF